MCCTYDHIRLCGEESVEVDAGLAAFVHFANKTSTASICPAKKARGLVSSNANQTEGLEPSASLPFDAKAGDGMPQRAIVSFRPPLPCSFALWRIADDRSHVIQEYTRKPRKIAGPIKCSSGELADRLLIFGEWLEITLSGPAP